MIDKGFSLPEKPGNRQSVFRPPIVAFAPHPWENHWLSRQQLLSRLGQRGWPVLYSYGPLSLWQRHTRPWKQASLLGGVQAKDHILVDQPGRWPPLWPKSPVWNQFVQSSHVRRLHGTLDKMASGSDLIAFSFYPSFYPYVSRLRARFVVYHVYDVYSLMDDWSPEKGAMEKAMTERADLITSSSAGMARSLPGTGPQRARVLHNGADSVRFQAASGMACPADLAAIPQPRIGYFGNINPKLDLEMVLSIAEKRSDWQWVFLGPVYMDGLRERDRQAKQRWQSCLTRPNVHFLGLKPREQLPAYVYRMDVNTICYRISVDDQGRAEDWVVHGYPTKLHEYLATGRPVVAAGQDAVKAFAHVVHIANTPAEWEAAIQQALTTGGVGTPAERQSVALENSWDKRVDQLEQWLLEMVENRALGVL